MDTHSESQHGDGANAPASPSVGPACDGASLSSPWHDCDSDDSGDEVGALGDHVACEVSGDAVVGAEDERVTTAVPDRGNRFGICATNATRESILANVGAFAVGTSKFHRKPSTPPRTWLSELTRVLSGTSFDCAICLETMGVPQSVAVSGVHNAMVTKCGHVFHIKCFQKHRKYSVPSEQTCAQCRENLADTTSAMPFTIDFLTKPDTPTAKYG